MKINVINILAGILILTTFGCGRYDYIDGNHDVVVKTRAIGTYDAILNEGSFDVEYIRDDTYSLEIEGESNLLEYIVTEVSNGELTIRTMRHISLKEHSPIVVYCYGPDINQIQTDGSGDVYFDTLVSNHVVLTTNGSGDMVGKVDANSMEATIRGSGDMVIRGEAKDTDLRIEGSGEIDAYDCEQEDCNARILGSGDIFTYVTDHLDARIDGSGSIYYKGNPTVSTTINGSGVVTNGK